MLRTELLLVLGVSFLQAAANGVLGFVYDVFNTPASTPVTVAPTPEAFDVYAFIARLIFYLFQLVPVALVAHLMRQRSESLETFGVKRSSVGRDAVVGVALGVAAVAAAYALYVAGHASGLPFRPIIPQTPGGHFTYWLFIPLIAVVAAVSEELIVNAYMLHRLRQIGWSDNRALGASALLRASFHLYQGIGGFIGNTVGGVVAGRWFQRTGRILPIVIAHALFDIVVTAGYLILRDTLPGLR